MELSKHDIEILSLLQRDSSLSTGAIAEQVNMSQSPCWRRINRIEQEGVIKRRVAILDRNLLGMEVVVFATVNLSTTGRQDLENFEQSVKVHPEVMECYTMTGIWDYMLKIVTRDIRHYEDFIRNKLTALPSIRELHSHMAVTEIKNSSELPLSTQL
ncbi:MAG: Lrp/AsnC family transcriptional regulator [Halieaceae bacterium]|jgi:Lrp/AsnC family transcriptional regulator